ncbi:MAG: energy transducer TonB [Bacteroidota bacterium]
METTSPSEKRKSFLIATCIYAVLLLILFFIRFWPPSDAELAMLAGGGGGGGVTINFGDSDVGSGADYKSEVLDVKSQAKPVPTPDTPEDAILSQDNEVDATDVVIPKKEKLKTPVKIKPEVKPEVVKPKVNNNANDALANILNGKNKGGDGDDKASGNKGKTNGDKNSNGYYGNGGSGGGTGGGTGTGNGTGTGAGSGSGSGGGNGSGNGLGNGSGYSLGNRKALTKPAPAYNCNEEGWVVVQITVDKNGNVVEAKPGARGTTNTANCLASQARIAAMKTKWEPSPDGAEKQVGTIKYNFSLKD